MQSTLPGKALWFLIIALAACLPAAVHAEAAPTTARTAPTAVPLVIHVPGIGGYLPVDRHFIRALKQGGVQTVELFDWTNGRPGLPALFNNANKQAQSRALADRITELHRADPDRPIQITAHSGGAAITVWALAQLPEEVTIDRVFLLAPALSPGYDLSRALQRVRDRAYVFSSDMDPVLGAGTRALGTMDGVRTDAMGRVGFDVPPDADPRQYAKLVPMPYDERWLPHDNIGDHIGSLAPRFARAILIPLLQVPASGAATQPAPAPQRR